ncbi:MAG: hypothetical protein SF066_19240 [Thermoanaerobaculia bacterium]|nr:hypothetical protein [Thermoanaerobaculia bacterium]
MNILVDTSVWSLALRRNQPADSPFDRCRARGVQGSNTDFLLTAVALRRAVPILTTDQDFERFAGVLPIRLHRPHPG